MFIPFFFSLREYNVPVTPKSFLRFQQALSLGLVENIADLYAVARTILIKSEKHFDLYDKIFAHHFHDAELAPPNKYELDDITKLLLEEWLNRPEELASALDLPLEQLQKMTPEQVLKYFQDRLQEQTEAHHGGNKWIGTGGTSPVGHSGYHPGGMRVGGAAHGFSAIKVAMERRYKDYSQSGPLTSAQIGEALKRLRRLIPAGPKNVVNVEQTVYQTMKNAGEIEIVFSRSIKDKLKVLLAIDNGGWSMDPYVDLVQVIFNYAQAQFKDMQTVFFHNTIYQKLYKDASRYQKPIHINDILKMDPETRLIIIGDASMAPYELLYDNGAIEYDSLSGPASYYQLQKLAQHFKRNVWLNPKSSHYWQYTQTIKLVADIFPMFEMSLNGLEEAITQLMNT